MLEAKLAAAEAAALDSETTLVAIHEQSRPIATGEDFWKGQMEEFLEMCRKEGQYRETTMKALRSYLKGWVEHLDSHQKRPSTALLAQYMKE